MKISEVMPRDVQTVRPDQSAQDAARFMLKSDAGSIPVTDGDRLICMITDRDITVRGVAKGFGPETPVSELMTRENLATVRIGTSQEEARRILHQRRIEKLLVVDGDDHCVGLITVKDIEKSVAAPLANRRIKRR